MFSGVLVGPVGNNPMNIKVVIVGDNGTVGKTIQINVERDEILSPAKIEAIQTAVKLGLLVETHSYGDPAQREALIEAGVRMFHTAIPDETLGWLREKGWR